MQLYREAKHRAAVMTRNIREMFLKHPAETREVAPVPDWTVRQAAGFLNPPSEVKISKEILQGIWLTHDYELKDPHYAAMIESRKNALLTNEWDIVPGGDRLMDIKAADFIRWNMNNMEMDMHGALDAALDAISKGFSIAEIVYELVPSGEWAGKYMLNKLKDKDQRFFRFITDEYGNLDPFGGVQFVNKWSMPIETYPPDKFFIFTFQKRRDNWYGQGLGEKCLWYMYFKKVGIKAWNVRLQKFANPTVIATHPPGISQTKKDDLLDSVKRLTSQSNIMFPDGPEGNRYAIDLVEASSGDGGYLSFIQYLDQAISKRILGGTLTMDPGTRGARSLGNIHQKNKLALSKFDALQLQDAFNEQIIQRLVYFNFPNAKPPKLEFRLLSNMDRKEWLESLVLCQQLGMQIPTEWSYELLQIKEPEGEEDVLNPEQNVRLGHRGGARTEPAPSDNADNSPYSEWEDKCDVEGVKNILRGMVNSGVEQCSQAIGQIRKDTHRTASAKFFSRENFIKEDKIEERLSLNVAPMRNRLKDMSLKSWMWGALTMMEAVERQGHTFFKDKDINVQEYFSDTPQVSEFFDRLPFGEDVYDSIKEEIKSRSSVIAGLTQKNLQHIIESNVRENLRNKCSIETFNSSFPEYFSGYDGENNEKLLAIVQNEVIKYFNEGRMAICLKTDASQFVGGLQFSGALGSIWPVSQVHMSKIYGLEDPIWSDILPPNGPSDMSFIAPVPKTDLENGGVDVEFF